MTKAAATRASKGSRGLRVYGALIALVIGLTLGAMLGDVAPGVHETLVRIATFVGGLWLNALKMTVIPLVVALLIVGIARGREAASAGRIAGRSVLWIVIICTASAAFGALMIRFLTSVFPLPRGTAEGLESALTAAEQKASAPLPGIGEFFKGIVPDNVFAAAVNGDVLPLVVFSVLFALALAQISAEGRRSVVGLFEAIADALLVIIGWVLWLAPLGVFALAYTVGSAAGAAAFAGLGHYIVLISIVGILVTLTAYPLAILAGRMPPGLFGRATLGPQAVAISTRSSLASLPAMLSACREMGVREQVADVTLPISVALFRATGPAMNVAVAFYVAHWLGLQPTLGQMIAATAVGAVMSYGAVSLPGEVSFISSIAPIALALGAPIAPLALLVAVEMIPDIFRTVGNVTMDVAVTAAVDRNIREIPENLNAS
ncbi:dicarboxylate/amino acid:cation symporter [Sphingomonas hankyongi]|uniref:Dicarboxylate/amino acid:cation symporter n=1 Tax=Sphingomonas hankyongi TaxID=2908209 RepID=A0ABT0S0Z1_9SPHN|nr:dicarboxylate/amino acid:cation symporter [Sphingomonas hankyongi]MCL6729533.1 dicarboxylate/amino acid:cation symporter [Sphingomonas hankyongi]